jgi:hypothetical protein
MRTLVFLLVLVNLLFFTWAQGYFGSPANPDALRLQQQLHPEQLTVIGRGDPPLSSLPPVPPVPPVPAEPSSPVPVEATPPAPAVSAVPDAEKPEKPEKTEKAPEKVSEKKEPNVCLIWNDLAIADADKLERMVVGKFSALKLKRRQTPGSGTYWVFIPPAASRQEADAKAAELKELGAPEFLIIQEAGVNRLAISLGVFSTQEAAHKRLAALREIRVSGALVGERNVKPAQASLEVRGAQGVSDALREAALTLLPKNKPSICKALPR